MPTENLLNYGATNYMNLLGRIRSFHLRAWCVDVRMLLWNIIMNTYHLLFLLQNSAPAVAKEHNYQYVHMHTLIKSCLKCLVLTTIL